MRLKIKNTQKFNDKLSQIISWGHWFTLFNIIFVIIIGSQYLIIADWPSTFMGRFYAIISCIGHFSFLCFAVYLITLFPLSFLVRSSSFIKIIGTLIATVGITLLLIDLEVFSHFRMHLNLTIWQMLISSDDTPLIREWRKLFIFIPLIFLLEILFALWSWKKLRSFYKRRFYVRPIVAVLILSFLASHLIHIWADAYFYRPITMQRSSLPLSYPMTARHFLAKYGFIAKNTTYPSRSGDNYSMAMSIEYPIGEIQFGQTQKPYNILIITVDGLTQDALNQMPFLHQFAECHLNYEHHYSASNQSDLSLFSLFYGLDANYYQSILSTSSSSALLDTLMKQRYNLGFFSSDDLKSPLYQQALLADFSRPHQPEQMNQQATKNWLMWFNDVSAISQTIPWFSWVNYQISDVSEHPSKSKTLSWQTYYQNSRNLDNELEQIITQLEDKDAFKNTIVVITANKGLRRINNRINLLNDENDFDRTLLEVPMVIAWPNKSAEKVIALTTHVDIMRTLMEEALQVTTTATKYSQGMNLFELPRKRRWVIAANENEIAALYPTKTIVIDQRGHYTIYDNANHKLPYEKLNLATFLELLTDNRRFLVTN